MAVTEADGEFVASRREEDRRTSAGGDMSHPALNEGLDSLYLIQSDGFWVSMRFHSDPRVGPGACPRRAADSRRGQDSGLRSRPLAYRVLARAERFGSRQHVAGEGRALQPCLLLDRGCRRGTSLLLTQAARPRYSRRPAKLPETAGLQLQPHPGRLTDLRTDDCGRRTGEPRDHVRII